MDLRTKLSKVLSFVINVNLDGGSTDDQIPDIILRFLK